MDQSFRYRKLITLLLVLLILSTSCSLMDSSLEDEKELKQEKFEDYVAMYEFVYGSQAQGNFQQLIAQFYDTFYANNAVNVNVSSYKLASISEKVPDAFEDFQQTIEIEPSFGNFDRDSEEVLALMKETFNLLQELENIYKSSSQDINYNESVELYYQLDDKISVLNRKMTSWIYALSSIQDQREQEELKALEDNDQKLAYIVLDSLKKSEQIVESLTWSSHGHDVDILKIEELLKSMEDYPTLMLNYSRDTKQLINVGLSAEEVNAFYEELSVLVEKTQVMVKNQRDKEAFASHIYDIIKGSYKRMLEEYNEI